MGPIDYLCHCERTLRSNLIIIVLTALVLSSCATQKIPHSEQLIHTVTSTQPKNLPTQTKFAPNPISNRLYLPVLVSLLSDRQPFAISTSAPIQITPTNPVTFTICSPIESIKVRVLPEIISSPYDPPPPGHDERHQGVDFAYFRRGGRASISGDGVQSVLPGRVAAVVLDRFPFGNMIIIETERSAFPEELAQDLGVQLGESLYLLYAHMTQAPRFELDQPVHSCQVLGHVGMTGNSGGAHLHLETRIGPSGQRFESMAYYDLTATTAERVNYLLWATSGTFRHFDPMVLLEFQSIIHPF
jgi:murein DD-endopeptidase MepM/ murein hydrolase activator NlpD